MIGVFDVGVYVPKYRLDGKTVGKAWGRPGRGQKAVANYDEDSATMGVAAALDCLGERPFDGVGALYFASTTSPYLEKQVASTVAAAVDLPRKLRTQDFAGSVRAGVSAFLAAADAVKSESSDEVLVVAADARLSPPGSPLELAVGDGASAVLVTKEHGDRKNLANLVGHYSVSDEITDTWRNENERTIRTGDPRFSRAYGYEKVMLETCKGLLDSNNVKPEEIAGVAIASPDGRTQGKIAKRLGLNPDLAKDPFAPGIGILGSAHPFLLLAAALERAKPDDLILFAAYGDGADAILLRATDQVGRIKDRALSGRLADPGVAIESYNKYLLIRDLIKERGDEMHPFSSTILQKRETPYNVRHHGRKCKACGTTNTLGLRVCPHCGKRDEMEEVKLAKKGTLHTYSQEHYYPTPEPPVTMAIIDLEDGSRFLTQLTDSRAEDVKIGMRLELTFRRLHEGGGFHNYCWKAKSVEGGE